MCQLNKTNDILNNEFARDTLTKEKTRNEVDNLKKIFDDDIFHIEEYVKLEKRAEQESERQIYQVLNIKQEI